MNAMPPHSYEAEQATIGCLLLAGEGAKAALAKLRASWFYALRHQTIFEAIRDLLAQGRGVDTITVSDWLTAKGKTDASSGPGYLAELTEATPSAANLDYYVPILRNNAARRELLELAEAMKALAMDETADPVAAAREIAEQATAVSSQWTETSPWLRFYAPSECREYEPPAGFLLVGDCHIVRGNVTVIAGPPGVGKSRALHALAVAGATPGAQWFGLPAHHRFKTLIIQNENGLYRLKQEFLEIGVDHQLDQFVRISAPPDFGMAFDHPEFRAALAHQLATFKPDVVGIDPWNSVAKDDRQRDYLETFRAVRSALPKGDACPAVVIVAHTRKPKGDERKTGRGLLNDVAGSHVLISVPRCVFVMQAGSEEVTDERVVWTCVKNNDGQHGERSAWYRRNGLFAACPDFDWVEFDRPAYQGNGTITEEDLDQLFDHGQRQLVLRTAVAELEKTTGFKKSACYAALNATGRFKAHLAERDGLICWTP